MGSCRPPASPAMLNCIDGGMGFLLFGFVAFSRLDFRGEELKIKLYFNCSCNLTGFCGQTFCSHLEIHVLSSSLFIVDSKQATARSPSLFPCSLIQTTAHFPRLPRRVGLSFTRCLREDRARCWALRAHARVEPGGRRVLQLEGAEMPARRRSVCSLVYVRVLKGLKCCFRMRLLWRY